MINDFKNKKILVIGDIILDEYIWGDVSRISPEAPIPVVDVHEITRVPGGAANVMANITALDGQCILCGVIGNDEPGLDYFSKSNYYFDGLIDTSWKTIVKTRVVARNQHVVRIDNENKNASLSTESELKLISIIKSNIDSVDCIIISDYCKGTVSPLIVNQIMEARSFPQKIIVDSKHITGIYAHADLITPNLSEAEEYCKVYPPGKHSVNYMGNKISSTLACSVLITQGKDGMTLFQPCTNPHHIPAESHDIADVTGAGDTVIATMALAMSAGFETRDAMRLANIAAGIVVGKVGTSTVSFEELINNIERR